MRSIRTVALLLLAVALPALGQVTLPTEGTLPPEEITRSLIFGDLLEQYREWWKTPANEHQKFWITNTNGNANRKANPAGPKDVRAAIPESAIAQCAALRWAMTGQEADLANALTALRKVPLTIASPFKSSAILLNYGLAYDFIRPAKISAADRALIEKSLLDSARKNLVFYDQMTKTNLRAKVAGTKAFLGVLLRDQELLDDGLRNLGISYSHNTTNDGWYTDGPGHYFNYTIPHAAAFYRAYQSGSDVNLYGNITPFVDMTLGMRMPDGMTPDVSQGGMTLTAVHMLAHGLAPTLKPVVTWHLTTGVPAAYSWGSYTNTINDDWSYARHFWATDLTAAPLPPDRSPTYFSPGEAKITVFRKDWTPESDYLLLSPGIDSPPHDRHAAEGIAYHSHSDLGEFIVYTHGQYVLVAPGYERQDLAKSPKGFTSRDADWHNVILVNGNQGERNEGRTTRPGDVVHTDRLDATRGCDFSTLAFGYGGAAIRRSAAFPGQQYFIIADAVAGEKVNDYTFNLVGLGTMEVLADEPALKRVQWTVGEATVTEHLVSSAAATLAHDQLWMHESYNVFKETRRMQATVQAQDALFLSIIDTGSAGDEALEVTSIGKPDCAAVLVRNPQTGDEDLVLSQAGNMVQRIGDVVTDARFAIVRRRDGVVRGGMIAGGMVLSVADKPVCRTGKAATLSFAVAGDRVDCTMSPDAASEEVEFFGGKKIATVTVSDIAPERGFARAEEARAVEPE